MLIESLHKNRLKRIKHIKSDKSILKKITEEITNRNQIQQLLENIFFEEIDENIVCIFKNRIIDKNLEKEFIEIYAIIGEQGIKCCIDAV